MCFNKYNTNRGYISKAALFSPSLSDDQYIFLRLLRQEQTTLAILYIEGHSLTFKFRIKLSIRHRERFKGAFSV